MKFNYDLYRPKKVIQDVYTPDNSYYQAQDVQVSPLTKIGDVANMPSEDGQGARQKARLLIQKLAPTFGASRAKKRTIPVRVADTAITHKRYVLGEGVQSGFSLWNFVASMKYALLGIALLGTGIGFMVVNLGGHDTVKSASDKSTGNVAASGTSHTTAKQKMKPRATQQSTPVPANPPQNQPQDTTTTTPAVIPAPSYSSTVVPSHTQAPTSPAPKPASTPSTPTQPTTTPVAATTQPTPSPTPQPAQPTTAPTTSQPSAAPTSTQPSNSTTSTTSPSTGSTSSPTTPTSSNSSTTTITAPQSQTTTP